MFPSVDLRVNDAPSTNHTIHLGPLVVVASRILEIRLAIVRVVAAAILDATVIVVVGANALPTAVAIAVGYVKGLVWVVAVIVAIAVRTDNDVNTSDLQDGANMMARTYTPQSLVKSGQTVQLSSSWRGLRALALLRASRPAVRRRFLRPNILLGCY